MELLIGAGQTLPALEKGILGMKVGEKRNIEIKAVDSPFGEYDATMIMEIPKSQLPPDLVPEVGATLLAQATSGEQQLVTIKEVKASTVIIDLNSPLAGKDLVFAAEIVTIRNATKEDLAALTAPPATADPPSMETPAPEPAQAR
jgi:peptidylprolyl isomerase